MVKLQKKSCIFLAVIFVLLALFSFWAAKENTTIYALIPLVSLLFFALLLVAFCLARDSWFSEHFKWEELRAAVLVMLAINLGSSALLLIAAEANHLDNTLDGTTLFRLSLLAGVPVGVMIWVKLSRIFDKKNIVMLKTFLISFALFSATTASQINRKLADEEESQITIDILKKEPGNTGLASWLTRKKAPLFIFIRNHNEEERLVVPKTVWSNTLRYASINLSVKEGYLGYTYVLRFDGKMLE